MREKGTSITAQRAKSIGGYGRFQLLVGVPSMAPFGAALTMQGYGVIDRICPKQTPARTLTIGEVGWILGIPVPQAITGLLPKRTFAHCSEHRG
jgi:hypothetical protein